MEIKNGDSFIVMYVCNLHGDKTDHLWYLVALIIMYVHITYVSVLYVVRKSP